MSESAGPWGTTVREIPMHRNVPSHGSTWWPALVEPLKTMGHRIVDFLSPPADASANDDAYVIELEIPGVSEADISIEVHGDQIDIFGEKRSSRDDKTDTYIFTERFYGAFRRSFRLPTDVDSQQIKAHAHDGVLRVTMPKRLDAGGDKRRIEIKRSQPRGITGDPRPNFE